jgi:predicted CoA-substrate-specific enzyme activase
MQQGTGKRHTTEGEACVHFEGLEIGAVSVKWVRLDRQGRVLFEVQRHGGRPEERIREILARRASEEESRIVVTGQAARLLTDLPYRSETECLEKALSFHNRRPDILLSLGGETFSVYPMKDGVIRNVISTSKCAAGTGEFILQQLQRMGLTLDAGLEQARSGRLVRMATRCSVHCKSDATHKLNKGECTPGDIARSLVNDLAKKVSEQVELARWPAGFIVVSGGVSRNGLFVEYLRGFLPRSEIVILEESPYLEAFGAGLVAAELSETPTRPSPARWFRASKSGFAALKPLKEAEPLLDYRVGTRTRNPVEAGGAYILGFDAGSTTTKSVLFNARDGSVGASSYLRTLGNPVRAARECLCRLMEEVGDASIRILQAGVTGSGRELVSVYLGNCPSFNEILAHARAAAAQVPDVDTVFEIGGQDSKYISFLEGVPVDYAMNEGCSAGTGSFIEESASVDMGVPLDAISRMAQDSRRPVAFGERCAAFINTDVRNALQQGVAQEDVIAGLVYSIAENYLSRIVGGRQIGERLLFLGGVALNRAVALALAARSGRRLVVPPHPELMGCVGVSQMILDRLHAGELAERSLRLEDLVQGRMETREPFRCRSCENHCEIQRIEIRGRTVPFGGLCAKYETARHREAPVKEGRDLVALRNGILFEEYGPRPVENPRGRIGLPMALTTLSLFPFYVSFIEALGYEAVLSRPSNAGDRKTNAPVCYPCEIMHGAVSDLFKQEVDFVLLPHVIEMSDAKGGLHSYTCPSTTQIPDLIRAAFPDPGGRILSPHIGLSGSLREATLLEVARSGARMGVSEAEARRAAEHALARYNLCRREILARTREALDALGEEPTVILAGRPYTICSPEVNLSLPRKITSRGYPVVPSDTLPLLDGALPARDVWHFTQQISNAVAHVRARDNFFLCLVSCFSCGPDSSMIHFFRRQLAGRTFCYLEIDSHTAHAGFDTRLGAFLDIIEEGRRKTGDGSRSRTSPRSGPPARNEETVGRARLSEGLDHIVDAEGRRVEYNDPRVVHVWTAPHSPHALRMIEQVYEARGARFRSVGRIRPETMQQARRLCSGRECVPMTGTVGATLEDVENRRSEDEITVYFTLDQEGPCQNGAWPLVWETFTRRLGAKNVICGVWPLARNNYLGLGNEYNLLVNGCLFLGDLFDEARNSLLCLARDREAALQAFEQAFARFLERFRREGDKGIDPALAEWAEVMSAVPLRAAASEAPKVLILGGLNVLFVHDPVIDYFLEQGIVPKLVPYSESLCWLAAETVVRHGFRHGLITPREQFAHRPSKADREEALAFRQSRLNVTLVTSVEKRFRGRMEPSGLLFDEPLPFLEIAEEGHKVASHIGFTETTVTAGRFVCSLKGGLYDGLVNLGSFNCQPAMNAQAVIRPLANASDVPYAAIDCEGPWLSAGQLRLLENVAVRAKRMRAAKNAAGSAVRPGGAADTAQTESA